MRGTRSRARGNGSPRGEEEEQAEEVQEVLRPRSPREFLEHIASFTSPGFSLFFILFFVVIAIFHENYSAQTSVAIACWFLIQLLSYVLKEDFSNELFWNILGLLGSVLVYVLVGHIWSYAKLYVDLWQKHLDPVMITKFRTCASTLVGNEVTYCALDIDLASQHDSYTLTRSSPYFDRHDV